MRLPTITNPLFAVSLALVAIAAFAEPSDMTQSKQATTESIKVDSDRSGYLIEYERISSINLDQAVEKASDDDDNKLSGTEPAHWQAVQSAYE